MASKILGLMMVIVNNIDKETAKKAVDAFLDKIEDSVKDSNTPIDDILILPVCKLCRNVFDIPDND